MILGQVLGQLAVVLVTPLLTRAYGPDGLGPYQVGFAISAVVQPLITLRAELVVPSMVHDGNAMRVVRLSRSIGAAVAIGGVIIFVGGAYRGGTGAASVAFVACICAATVAATVVDNSRLIRLGEYHRLAVRNGLAGLLGAAFQAGVAAAGLSVVWLAVGFGAGRFAALAMTYSRTRLDESDAGVEIRPYGVRRAVPSILSGLVASATAQVLNVSSASLGFQAAAFATTSQRIAGAPLALMGQGLSQVLQASVAPRIRRGNGGLTRRLVRQALGLTLIAAIVSSLLILLAPRLAVPLLGEGWERAGTVVAVLAIPMSMQLVVGPLVAVLPMLAMEGRLLALQVGRLVLVGSATVVGVVRTGDLIMTATAFGVATVVGYIVLITFVLRAAVVHDRGCTSTLEARPRI